MSKVSIIIIADFDDYNASQDLIETLNLVVPHFGDNVSISSRPADACNYQYPFTGRCGIVESEHDRLVFNHDFME